MRLSAERRLSVAWVVVVTITLIYLVIDGSVDDSDVMRASTVASVAAIGLALVKVRNVMRELMATGKVLPVIDRCYRLSEVPQAIAYLAGGHARGKVVITLPAMS